MDLKGHRLILASKSPRRAELLRQANITFEIKSIETDESYPADTPIENIAGYIAYNKAIVHKDHLSPTDIVIAADTIVEYEGIIYGKPKTREEAISTLLKLSDTTHSVYSGVCLLSNSKEHVFTHKSDVTFNKISEEEAIYYYDNWNPSDKAGSYGIQDWIGISKVDKIDGSYTNILGLPMAAVYKNLLQFLEDK